MNIIIDTNVFISAVFFGGVPQKIIEAVVRENVSAFATREIVAEYEEIVQEMESRKQGKLRQNMLTPFLEKLHMIVPKTKVAVCRDPDDDKFISCAIDAGAIYIVSGDKDLLALESYGNIEIVTAKEFCDREGL